jgi:hypothetical protein
MLAERHHGVQNDVPEPLFHACAIAHPSMGYVFCSNAYAQRDLRFTRLTVLLWIRSH